MIEEIKWDGSEESCNKIAELSRINHTFIGYSVIWIYNVVLKLRHFSDGKVWGEDVVINSFISKTESGLLKQTF